MLELVFAEFAGTPLFDRFQGRKRNSRLSPPPLRGQFVAIFAPF